MTTLLLINAAAAAVLLIGWALLAGGPVDPLRAPFDLSAEVSGLTGAKLASLGADECRTALERAGIRYREAPRVAGSAA